MISKEREKGQEGGRQGEGGKERVREGMQEEEEGELGREEVGEGVCISGRGRPHLLANMIQAMVMTPAAQRLLRYSRYRLRWWNILKVALEVGEGGREGSEGGGEGGREGGGEGGKRGREREGGREIHSMMIIFPLSTPVFW